MVDTTLQQILEKLDDNKTLLSDIIAKTDANRTEIDALLLKFELVKQELKGVYRVVHGDGMTEPLQVRLKSLERDILEAKDAIVQINKEHKTELEQAKSRNTKIVLTLLGGLVTAISSIISYVLGQLWKSGQ
jgi:hypothetical protein